MYIHGFKLQTPVAELMAKQSENCDELELSARERNRAKRKARLLAKNNSKEDSKSANGYLNDTVLEVMFYC